MRRAFAALPLFALAACVAQVDDRGDAERFLGTPLPAEATGVDVEVERGIDRLVQLRFEAPADVVERFAGRFVPGGPKPPTEPFAAIQTRPFWPEPLPPGALVGKASHVAANRHYTIVTAPAGAGRRRLWLVGFEL